MAPPISSGVLRKIGSARNQVITLSSNRQVELLAPNEAPKQMEEPPKEKREDKIQIETSNKMKDSHYEREEVT